MQIVQRAPAVPASVPHPCSRGNIALKGPADGHEPGHLRADDTVASCEDDFDGWRLPLRQLVPQVGRRYRTIEEQGSDLTGSAGFESGPAKREPEMILA